jgi:hypothetical protein
MLVPEFFARRRLSKGYRLVRPTAQASKSEGKPQKCDVLPPRRRKDSRSRTPTKPWKTAVGPAFYDRATAPRHEAPYNIGVRADLANRGAFVGDACPPPHPKAVALARRLL